MEAFKEVITGVAQQHQLAVSFHPKPFEGGLGSGCHLHLSVWQVRSCPLARLCTAAVHAAPRPPWLGAPQIRPQPCSLARCSWAGCTGAALRRRGQAQTGAHQQFSLWQVADVRGVR